MPNAQERKLKKVAKTLLGKGDLKRLPGESAKEAMARFVYGTMRNQGWKPKTEKR